MACNPGGCGGQKPMRLNVNEVLRVNDLDWSEWTECLEGERSRYRMANEKTKVKMEFDSEQIEKWNQLIEREKCPLLVID